MNKLFDTDTILETKNFIAGQDWEIPIEGFFVIGSKDATKRKVTDFDLSAGHELIELIQKVRNAMQDVLHIDDVYIFQNEDTEHGFHIWLFPRHSWMEKFGRKIESVRPIMKFAASNRATENDILQVKKVAKKVRDYLAK